MLINDTPLYDKIWDWVFDTLRFSPNGLDSGHDLRYGAPFVISVPHIVYGTENMTRKQAELMETLVSNALLNVTATGQRLFALDWQHDCFLYDPRTDKTEWTQSPDGLQPCCDVFFPDFYPDGDYYSFIDEDMQFGYLGHPWRDEVWIFGDCLVKEFEKIYHQLGWYKIDF